MKEDFTFANKSILQRDKTSPQPTLGEGVQPTLSRILTTRKLIKNSPLPQGRERFSVQSTVQHLFSYSPINLFTHKKYTKFNSKSPENFKFDY